MKKMTVSSNMQSTKETHRGLLALFFALLFFTENIVFARNCNEIGQANTLHSL
jgi:hypothetical protein